MAMHEARSGIKNWAQRFLVPVIVSFILLLGALGAYVVHAQPTKNKSNQVATRVSVTPFGPALVSQLELANEHNTVKHAVYWAGRLDNTSYELTVTASGSTYIRYLPIGALAGSTQEYLTIGSYAKTDAYQQLQTWSKKTGAVSVRDKGGALVVRQSANAKNTYFAFKNSPLLVEVFSPLPNASFDLIQSGKILQIK